MFNETAVDSARPAHSVPAELRNHSLIAVEREIASNKPLVDEDCLDALASRIAMHIESIVPRGRMRCLELGCGDAALVDAIRARAPRTDWFCIDVDRAPPGLGDSGDYHAGDDGWAIPYGDGEFDVALLCDVLHDAPDHAARLLAEVARVAPRVLVKDRFAARYFTRQAFVSLAAGQRLVITALDCDLSPRQHLPAVRARRRADGHFIAALFAAEHQSPHAVAG